MTRKFYPFAPEKPLATRIQLPITHVVQTPQGSRTIQLNTNATVIRQLVKAGWTVVEDRTVKS